MKKEIRILEILKNIRSLGDINITSAKYDENWSSEGNIGIAVIFNGIKKPVQIHESCLDYLGAFYYYKESVKALKLAKQTIICDLSDWFDCNLECNKITKELIDIECKRIEKLYNDKSK